MTSFECPAPAVVVAGDLRELIPYMAGWAGEVLRRAAVLIETQADLLAVNPPTHADRVVVEQLAAHHERTTGLCHVCGWEHPAARAARRGKRWRQR